MDIVSFLIPYTELKLFKQPRKGAFHNPADLPQAASVLGIAAGNHRTDAALPQRFSDLFFDVVRAEFQGEYKHLIVRRFSGITERPRT
jgi:hypothetical protein